MDIQTAQALGELQARLSAVEARIGSMEARMDRMETRMDRMENKIDKLLWVGFGILGTSLGMMLGTILVPILTRGG